MRRVTFKNRPNLIQRRRSIAIESLGARELMAADMGPVLELPLVKNTESVAAHIDTTSMSTISNETNAKTSASNSSSATNATALTYISNGYLYIVGTDEADGRDNVSVRSSGTQGIEVVVQKWNDNRELLGSYRDSFSRSRIPNGIRFYGYAGKDTFLNNTDLPSFASGGEGDDVLYGGSVYDSLYGDNGDDLVSGGGGGDFLNGGVGDDLVSGGAGRDIMLGGYGNDNMYGSSDSDTMYGGPGRDYMDGGSGDDYMYGEGDADKMFGSLGSDYMRGGAGADEMTGDSVYLNESGGGHDRMYGDEGEDKLIGNSGNDFLDGGVGSDRLFGGNGHDRLFGRDGWDRLSGGRGNDYLDGGYDTKTDYMLGDEGRDTFVRHRSALGSPGLGDWFADVTSIDRIITDWHW